MGHIYRLLALVLVVGGIVLCTPRTAEATLSSQFTNGSHSPTPGADLYPMVTIADGSTVTLDANVSEFFIFLDSATNATVDVVIEKACTSSGVNDVGNTNMQVRVEGTGGATYDSIRNNTSGCSGADIRFNNISSGVFTDGGSTYPGFKYLRVTATKTTAVGIKAFRVRADTGGIPVYVTFDDENNPTNSGYPSYDAFSLWNADPSAPSNTEANMKFRFSPACTYSQSDSVWLKWYDADYGAGNESGNISWVLTDTTTGAVVASQSNAQLGGNGVSERFNVGNLQRNHRYEWEWRNVDKINGIQIWMPFSELFSIITCGSTGNPPEGDIGATGCGYVKGWARDPDSNNRLQYRLSINAGAGGGGVIWGPTTTNSNDYRPGHGFNAAVNLAPYYPTNQTRTLTLEGRGLDASGAVNTGWVTLASEPRTKNCTSGPAPPSFTIEVRCDGVVVHDLSDPQDAGTGVAIYGTFFHRYWDGVTESYGAASNFYYDDQPEQVFIPWPENLEDGQNQGWAIHIGAYDLINGAGADANPRLYFSGEVEGACYQATCSLDVLEPAGFPANGVKGNEPFGVNVTISNPPNAVPVSSYFAPTHPYRAPSSPGAWDYAGGAITATNPIIPWHPAGSALSTTINPGAPWGPNPYWPYDFPENPPGSSIPWGGSQTVTETYNAPNDRNIHTLQMYPDYWGLMGIGPNCATSVLTHLRYDFNATAASTLQPDTESPAQANFNTGITKAGVADVEGSALRQYYRESGGAATPLAASTISAANPDVAPPSAEFGSKSYTDTYGIPAGSYQVGDAFCVSINLDRGHGWRGPGSGSYVNEGPAYATNCATPPICPVPGTCGPPPVVVNHPYFRVYGGDIVAGGGFGASCTASGANILAYMRPPSEQNPGANRSGSGAQLAAMALGEISGFTSASIRSAAPVLPKDLTFAHDTSPPADNQRTVLGGNMAGGGWCAPDYFSQTQYPDGDTAHKSMSSSNNIGMGSLNAPPQDKMQTLVTPTGGKLRLNGNGAANYANHHTLYVDGDVFIRDNIMYTPSYAAGITSIPSFTLVVKGDIYIDNNVTQLDGLYIAQPRDDGTKGSIYTCSRENGGTPDYKVTDPAELYNECGAAATEAGCAAPGFEQLTVNGAFIANKIVLNRTGHSLRCSTFRELYNASKAAEVFNFTPELWLSPPVFSPRSTATSGEYDYISTLPPIL